MTTKSKSTRHSRSGRHISLPTRYRAPTPTYSPHHHLYQLRTSTLPSSLTHCINTDSIHHCDSESLLSLSDNPLTSSSHADRHLEPKCVVCHLSSRRKSGLSCIKCHNYFHLSCIKPRIPLNTARMLPSWHCSDCLFGTVTSSGEPSITGATSSEPVFDPIGVLNSAVYSRQTNRVFLRIPKSCRIQAASALSDTINNALSSQTPLSWTKLFFFAIDVFGIPTQSGNYHKTSKTAQKIQDNLRRHLLTSSTDILCQSGQLNHSLSYNRRPSVIDNHKRLRQLVNRHLSVNDVPAAVRAVASDDILCDINPDVLESLQSRHPPATSNIEIIPIPTNIPSMTTSSQDIQEAIRSFSGSSGGGVDGLRPIHLQDLISEQTAEAGNRLILSLTSLVNTILNGQISDFARIIFFSANLTALRKKDGGIRPIAVGNILRRLTSNVANHFASHKVANF